jgi:hypothetical protein
MKKIRISRFSLKSLCLLVAVLAVGLAAIVHRANTQRRILDSLAAYPVSIYYSTSNGELGMYSRNAGLDSRLLQMSSLRESTWLPVDFKYSVSAVSTGTPYNFEIESGHKDDIEKLIALLKQLPALETIYVLHHGALRNNSVSPPEAEKLKALLEREFPNLEIKYQVTNAYVG